MRLLKIWTLSKKEESEYFLLMCQKRLLFRHNKCRNIFAHLLTGFGTFLDSKALNHCLIDKSRWSWQIVLRAGKISSAQQSWVSIYKSIFQEWSLKLSKSFKFERKVKVEFKHVISNNARGVQYALWTMSEMVKYKGSELFKRPMSGPVSHHLWDK